MTQTSYYYYGINIPKSVAILISQDEGLLRAKLNFILNTSFFVPISIEAIIDCNTQTNLLNTQFKYIEPYSNNFNDFVLVLSFNMAQCNQLTAISMIYACYAYNIYPLCCDINPQYDYVPLLNDTYTFVFDNPNTDSVVRLDVKYIEDFE